MKKMTIIYVLLFSFFALADNRISLNESGNKEERKQMSEIVKNAFDVLPLNSPVKESTANFHIKINGSLEIEEVMYRIQNAGRIFEKPTEFQKAVLSNGSEGKILKVNVSKLPPGFYQLFVKIKDKKGTEHLFKTKYKDHAMFVIDYSKDVLAPDTKKNNATIAGVDSDNDGIRDDVQIWINNNLSNIPNPLKLAFKQYAVAMQTTLLTANDKQISILASHVGLRAQDCLYSQSELHGVDAKYTELNRMKIKSMYLNTKERIESELQSDENFHGQEVRNLASDEACNF